MSSETTKAPPTLEVDEARVAKDLADSFEAAMETGEALACGLENPEQCESCT